MLPLSFVFYGVFSIFNDIVGGFFFCFSLLIPLLYFSNWDYRLIFHRLSRNEIILAFLMFAIYMVYSIAMGSALEYFHLVPTDAAPPFDVNIGITVSLIFSMMGEELLKFIPLMFFMRLFYRFTENRNLSLAISIVIVLIGFGMLHYDPASSSIASVLLLQGVGSLVEMYGYIKTKNLFVPYISHLLTDGSVFVLILLNII